MFLLTPDVIVDAGWFCWHWVFLLMLGVFADARCCCWHRVFWLTLGVTDVMYYRFKFEIVNRLIYAAIEAQHLCVAWAFSLVIYRENSKYTSTLWRNPSLFTNIEFEIPNIPSITAFYEGPCTHMSWLHTFLSQAHNHSIHSFILFIICNENRTNPPSQLMRYMISFRSSKSCVRCILSSAVGIFGISK